MHRRSLLRILFIALGLTAGCDHTRVGGTYGLRFLNDAAYGGRDRAVTDEGFQRRLRDWFTKHGFHEESMVGTNEFLWKKSGSGVRLTKDAERIWLIRFRAMGHNGDLRTSEATERDLMTHLANQSNLKVIYIREGQMELALVGDDRKPAPLVRAWLSKEGFRELTATASLSVWGDRDRHGVAAICEESGNRCVVAFGQMGFDKGWIAEQKARELAGHLEKSPGLKVTLVSATTNAPVR